MEERRIERERREVRSIEFGDGAPPPYFRIVFAGMRLMRAASPRRNTGVGDCEWDDDADGDDARRARERGRAERSQSGRARLRSLSTAGLTSFSSHRRDGRSNLVITLHRFPFFETPNRAPNLARLPAS